MYTNVKVGVYFKIVGVSMTSPSCAQIIEYSNRKHNIYVFTDIKIYPLNRLYYLCTVILILVIEEGNNLYSIMSFFIHKCISLTLYCVILVAFYITHLTRF